MKKQNLKKDKVSIFIAVLNEEKIIDKVVVDCKKLKEFDKEIFVVIDSKTKDKTKQVAEKAGATVINTGKWLGKGAALRKSLHRAKGNFIVQIDGDYQFMPLEIPKLIKKLQLGYDVALGSRHEKGSKVQKDSVTSFRNFGAIILSLATTIFCRQRVSDVLAGFKAFKTDVLKDVNMQEDHYGYEAEMVIKAAQKGYKIINVPVSYKKRLAGHSNVNPIKHGLLFLGSILKAGFNL